ncbi:MAG: ATP-binding cassette domain-containing protein [Treponema sp.]|nr:ATP-binding cassette domain-containing protein [Treponema sp.]
MTNNILEIKNLSVSYTSSKRAVTDVTTSIERNKVTAIMGPSGCGKSTLLRAINLMHQIYPNILVEGEIIFNNANLLKEEPMIVRRNIGMVFQRPNPFPTMSIAENVLAGYMLNFWKTGILNFSDLNLEFLKGTGFLNMKDFMVGKNLGMPV